MPAPLAIILGAGSPYRGEQPSALVATPGRGHVLDWLIDAFRAASAEVHFVGGYRHADVAAGYPDLSMSLNPRWASTGAAGSLFAAPLEAGRTTFVCYSDVVFRRDVVERVGRREADVVLGVDRAWRDRYLGRPRADLVAAEKVCVLEGVATRIGAGDWVDEADAEFIGLLKLSPRGVEALLRLRTEAGARLEGGGVPALLMELAATGIELRVEEVDGEWAELNAPQDLARFVLGTKAETLDRLQPLVRLSHIGDQVRLLRAEWEASPGAALEAITARFGARPLIVRSSAPFEDGWTASNAGSLTSVLDVRADAPAQIVDAVARVLHSYGEDVPEQQVLVQAMLDDVRLSGVVTTRTLDLGAPYYVINYDDITSRTDVVTSGGGAQLRTVLVHRGADEAPAGLDGRLRPVLAAVRELEALVGHDRLDVEFAIAGAGAIVHTLQVRPLVVSEAASTPGDDEVERALGEATAQFHAQQARPAHLVGERATFGVMPDWNPAEIIGTRPRALAFSLYRMLVTEEVWAQQRAEYGYRDVRPAPLLTSFAGHPYVDVRADFNSWIPASVDEALASRLVEHYLCRLHDHPEAHDKIEFEIAFTCLTPSFDRDADRLRADGFTEADLAALRVGLRAITRGAFERYPGDLAQIEVLEDRYANTCAASLPPLERVRVLLNDCWRFGTLPFAHLARGAFVAEALLRSLEACGALTPAQTEAFRASLRTVAKRFVEDGAAVAEGAIPWSDFEARYRHLRPGTYEITSATYGDDPERYLRPMVAPRAEQPSRDGAASTWDAPACAAVAGALQGAGLPDDVEAFEAFLRGTFEGRESAKFAFSRNLSAALDAIAEWGASCGLTRDQLSHLTVEAILDASEGDGAALATRAAEGERAYRLTLVTELPPLIFEERDITCFERPVSQPNFVTTAHAVAPVYAWGTDGPDPGELAERIVLIPRADPGFDWLFGHHIAGLITMYGGANSHMAIRAAEFGLPAAIGVGEARYVELARAQVIDLDCATQRVQVVR